MLSRLWHGDLSRGTMILANTHHRTLNFSLLRLYSNDKSGVNDPSVESDTGPVDLEDNPRRRASVKSLTKELGFNPLQDLYGLKSMPTDVRTELLQKTLLEEELKRRRLIDFPQLRARAEPWTPSPTPPGPFVVSYHTYVITGGDPTYPRGWKVKVKAAVQDLAKEYGMDETAVKKMKLIAGPRYHPETDSIKIVCKHRPSRKENLARIEKMFAQLITASKDKKETFDDITVEAVVSLTRKKRPTRLVYPESWKILKKPDDAAQPTKS